MDEQIQKNLYAWRAFHLRDGHLTPIWYAYIDANESASSIADSEMYMKLPSPNKPYNFDLHGWNCSDVTPAQDVEDQEWMAAMRGTRLGIMRATQAGFHSFHHAIDAVDYADHNSAEVVGKVQLAGRIIEHEFGYRSQFMRIIELYGYSAISASRMTNDLGWPFEIKPFSHAVKEGGGIIASFLNEGEHD
jgi:hypothetical protein